MLRKVESVQTKYQKIDVWSSGDEVEFRVAGAVHAWWHKERYLTGLAWDNIIAAALLHPETVPKKILMLGLAGGTTFRALRHLLPDAELHAVEIDEEVVHLARKHMALDELNIHIHIADAYKWLDKGKKKYDVIIDDVYLALADDVARPDVWDDVLIKKFQSHLNPYGLFLTNLVRGEGHRAMQTKVRQAFRRNFFSHYEVRTPEGLNETLCGGDEIATKAALSNWLDSFTDFHDRALWKKITVRKF